MVDNILPFRRAQPADTQEPAVYQIMNPPTPLPAHEFAQYMLEESIEVAKSRHKYLPPDYSDALHNLAFLSAQVVRDNPSSHDKLAARIIGALPEQDLRAVDGFARAKDIVSVFVNAAEYSGIVPDNQSYRLFASRPQLHLETWDE